MMLNKTLNIKINSISYALNLLEKTIPTILEYSLSKGIYIPHFCYNKYLLIAGNCRICIVEVEKFLKPIISCLNLCIDNLSIYTNSFSLKKLRENVLEFLLINHPLDCPICDQAGECDLQEQTLKYGLDRSRFFFKKKTNFDIYLNNYIKLILNRCILCLRCVRFLRETPTKSVFLGTIGRGSFSKINLYTESKIQSFDSSNIIDICPVGALTLKLSQFSYRPWEFTSVISFDLFDSFASPVKLDFKNNKLVRILPYLDPIFFVDFISDITRFKLNLYSNFYNYLNININEIQISSKLKSLKNFMLFNFDLNPLVSFKYLSLIFKNIYLQNKYYNSIVNIQYNFNNVYIFNSELIHTLSKSIKLFQNFNLQLFMYRFFFFLNEINKTFNNLVYYNTEDMNILKLYNFLNNKNYIFFTSKLSSKFNYLLDVYLIKYLSFFKTLLNLDDISIFALKPLSFISNMDVLLINFKKVTNQFLTKFKSINIFNKKNIIFDDLFFFNILGKNVFFKQEYLTEFNVSKNYFFYKILFFNILIK